jgi:hypothetical protein
MTKKEEEEPNEFTVLMRIVDVIGDSLNHSRSRQLDQRAHADLINIINFIDAGGTLGSVLGDAAIEVQETVVGDSYTTGQAGAVGPFSSSANNTFNQIWSQNAAEIDLDALAAEPADVRAEMRKRASTPQEDLALAEVGQAQVAASEKDGARAIGHLGKAGRWALGVATSIGAGVAAAAIKGVDAHTDPPW